MPTDRWTKIVSSHSNIRGVAIQATELVRELAQKHQVANHGARGLGEAVVGGILLASFCKSGEHINLNIQGSGHIRQALVDAHPDGTVRGYVIERDANVIAIDADQGPWGSGLLSVLRTKKGAESKQPYIGTVPLVTGHLAKDLTFYWMQSEQIPSAVGIVTEFEGDQIAAAGGFLVQALPGASPEEIHSIESQINQVQSLAGELVKNASPIQLLSRLFQNTAFSVVEERELKFQCTCSWERVKRALALVGVKELRSMLKEDGKAFVRCDFCSKEYEIDGKDLESMIASAKPESEDS